MNGAIRGQYVWCVFLNDGWCQIDHKAADNLNLKGIIQGRAFSDHSLEVPTEPTDEVAKDVEAGWLL